MPKFSALTLLLFGILLLGTAQGQQVPATKTSATPPGKGDTSSQTATTTKTSEDVTLATQKDIFSYALGMNVGEGLHQQSVEINPDVFTRGVKDALAGGKTLLSDDEAKATLAEAQNEWRQKQPAKMKEEGEANKLEGEKFLAANKTKDGIVTLPSGLQYKILKQGTGPKPTASDSVVCNYRGTLINGKEFDNSYKRGKPATFQVSAVIKGWVEALQLMPVGSKWQLFVPPDLAYGDRVVSEQLGPDSSLIFEVELISIQPKAASGSDKAPGN